MNYYKNSEEISNAAKKGWIKLKEDDEKYRKWLDSRSNYMKELSTEEQRRRANIFWENISEDDYKHACDVYDKLGCKTFYDYHMAYLKCDVLLLADIF